MDEVLTSLQEESGMLLSLLALHFYLAFNQLPPSESSNVVFNPILEDKFPVFRWKQKPPKLEHEPSLLNGILRALSSLEEGYIVVFVISLLVDFRHCRKFAILIFWNLLLPSDRCPS